ncbi:hypothetical protein G0027_02485 [Acinetobacter indicus]|uniref:Uncharacterized protein n=1 Tax=Acinetobacter indicus TaxID=756892 RepID=A0A7S6VN82_9GAMM|nr:MULTISPECIES: hypothetical protein [Acinetobacter]QOW41815.1 hypothetical protein G0027_02485 [Acinetobacter indicus]
MATIRELYQNAGNPNLTHWKDIKILSIAEASLLTCAINPIDYEFDYNSNLVFQLKHKKPINWMDCLMLMRALVEAIATQELKSPLIVLERENDFGYYGESIEQSRTGIDDIDTMSYPKTKIHREELKEWLKKRDYFEQQLSVIDVESTLEKAKSFYPHNNEISLLPEPTYTTPALDALNGVVQEFWINYDPESNLPIPKQSVVEEWIKENYPDVQGAAMRTYIDKICRHPIAKGGRIKKINP